MRILAPRLMPWLCLAGALVACGRPTPRGGAKARVDPRDHARSEAARRAALQLGHAEVRKRLGGHVLSATHKVASTLDGKPVGDGSPGPVFHRMRGVYDAYLVSLMDG